MYEELIERLRTHAKSYEDMFGKGESSVMMQEAADAIEDLSEPRWISVEERLPEMERKSYWVCTDAGYQCECRWTNNRFGIRETDKWGWSVFDIPQYQKVVAWMPLPEPYKEET